MNQRTKAWLGYTGQNWRKLNGKARVSTIFAMQFYDLENPVVAVQMWQIHANNRVFRVVTDRDGAIGVARMIGSSHIVSPEGQRIKL